METTFGVDQESKARKILEFFTGAEKQRQSLTSTDFFRFFTKNTIIFPRPCSTSVRPFSSILIGGRLLKNDFGIQTKGFFPASRRQDRVSPTLPTPDRCIAQKKQNR